MAELLRIVEPPYYKCCRTCRHLNDSEYEWLLKCDLVEEAYFMETETFLVAFRVCDLYEKK